MTDNSMWANKYQPKSMNECVLDGLPENVQAILIKSVTNEMPPNVLLFGPAGTGKTSIARLLVDANRHTFNWCFGSRIKLKDIEDMPRFVRSRGFDRLPKVVVIDGVDLLTKSDQRSLGAHMEQGRNGSWIITTTSLKDINQSLSSRMIQIDLCPKAGRKDHLKGVVRRCQQILHAENIRHVSDDDIYKIANDKYPDMRRTINELQSRYMFESEASLDVPELVPNLQEERIENEYATFTEEN